ncbi:hypothetical protein DFR29_10967 [Tahibacter aquaticus]|uniref:VWFD domain-containing protein n=1 Tax=Tahibacter aquaticus TaxID=520092 RepID=A0A4R6YUA6_9GAMM|nr:hypothetical protein [Tahibacter aquaticus]TDR42011.1 hypothetical protein DFR29_10967 [Tahibacter aquaticus]
MQVRSQAQRLFASVVAVFLGVSGSLWSGQALSQDEQPIATIGHGAFFDSAGRQITLTQASVAQIQSWYRADLLSGLDERKQAELAQFENDLYAGVPEKGQARLIFQQRALEWLYVNSTLQQEDQRTLGKLRALDFALGFTLPERAEAKFAGQGTVFDLDPALARKLQAVRSMQAAALKTATTNSGLAYINECIAAGVPIPPSIGVMDPAGLTGWKVQGFIPTGLQFIVGTPAEVRTYQSTSPLGMCYALPRYSNAFMTTVALDGVICLSQVTSKVCIWDNQMMGSTFSFLAGATIPIGVPNLMVDPAGRYQAGGNELLGGSGGVCTDCHAGENPYITHPKANLGAYLWETLSQPPQNLPTFAPNRYDPLVPASWPQNQLSQAGPTVPGVCAGCHVKFSAGRFPHLSNQLPDYCSVILPQAIATTMPPFSPGSASVVATAFKNAYCFAPPNAASGDAGDPHITTTNGIHYDFQAAGEFVVLKNSDSGFEVQSRQSPVQTSFIPPANPYTGLASCVSLNTAVAARVGTHRVSYQPVRGSANKEQMQVRIDGVPVQLTPTPINLGGGNVVVKAAAGDGLEIHFSDGTDLTVTPRFWTSEGYWYLDIDVRNTPAREGIAGHILAGDWLPRAPDGSSFGPRPVPLANRHIVLNQIFADAWRVSATSSLFDYATGTSTANFTDRNWPTPSGVPCRTSLLPSRPPLTTMWPELAQEACRGIQNEAKLAHCVFDVTVMGDRDVARGYFPPGGTGGGTGGDTAPTGMTVASPPVQSTHGE